MPESRDKLELIRFGAFKDRECNEVRVPDIMHNITFMSIRFLIFYGSVCQQYFTSHTFSEKKRSGEIHVEHAVS